MKTLVRALAGALVAVGAFGVGQALTTHADPFSTPCKDEGSVSCYWDAAHRGNHQGLSFVVDSHGEAYYAEPAGNN